MAERVGLASNDGPTVGAVVSPDPVPDLVAALREHWGVRGSLVEYEPGSQSRAWLVDTDTGPVVAKLAGTDLAHFELGLRVSEVVQAAGIRAGAPIRARDGAVAIDLGHGRLAVLEHVPGQPAAPEHLSIAELAALLATVHRCTAELQWPGAWTLDDVVRHTKRGILASHPVWVGEFIRETLDRVVAWAPERSQLLRGDGPELLVEDGVVTGMIDWGATKWGSVADDIGCWTLHLGRLHGDYARVTSEFIAAYRDTAPLTDREEGAVSMFQRLRLATRPPYVQDESALRGIKRWIDEWIEAITLASGW